MIRTAIIAAVAENGVLGRDNDLPWRLPRDLRHFKEVTAGKPVIMGRRTFESIGGRPLPGRTNIVVTRQSFTPPPGVETASSLHLALNRGREVALLDGVDEVMVVGGSAIYEKALPLADRLYITEVHCSPAGDTYMPAIDWSRWREVSREYHEDAGASCAMSIVIYDAL